MTETPYGNYQTPSSRPPEPPYRSGSQGTSTNAGSNDRRAEPDLSGFDERGEAPFVSYSESPARFGDTGTMPQGAYNARHAPNGYASTVRTAPGEYGAAQAKQPSAAKTFLFGFLGALLACVLAIGGFTAYNHFNTRAMAASTTLGTSDPSVINAIEDGQTLGEAVAAKALNSVVAVYNYQQVSSGSSYGYGYGASNSLSANDGNLQAAGMGSGVLISKDGYILTNYHVVDGAAKLTVKVGDEERNATYVGGDNSSDVAVIKIDDTTGLTVADIGNSDDLVIGEWVMTIGAPLGLEQSVATGVVSATNRSTVMDDSQSSDAYSYYYGNSTPSYTYYPNMIQTDAVINPGNSGGALVDGDGKLIGINTMISSYSGDYAGVGFAIPVNYAMGIAEQVISGKEPTHAMLGVSVSSVTSNNAKRYGLATTSGAYISAIAEGTGAAESGLKEGDIITAIDGKTVTSSSDVTLDVREHNPGDTVKVTVNRNGETKDFDVVLSSDEGKSTSSGNSQNQQQQQQQGQGQGYGYGQGQGNGRGMSSDQLDELLKMLGM